MSDQPDSPKADPKATHVTRSLKHNSPLIGCRFDPTGRFVFVSSEDSRITRFALADGKKTEMAGHESWTRGMAFDPRGETLVTGGYDGRIIFWPAAADQPEPARTIEAHDGWVRAVAVSPDGKLLATAGNDRLVKLWDMADGRLVRELRGHESHVYNVAFHPAGGQLVSGDLKLHLKQWDLADGKETRSVRLEALHKYDTGFRADIGGPRGLAFSRDGKRLAACGITAVTNAFAGVGNPAVVVVDWESGKATQTHLSQKKIQGCAWGVALHPDGFTVAAIGGSGGWLLFWKPDEQHEMHAVKLPNVARDLDLHGDGLQLATAHHDGQVRISRLAK